MAVRNVISTLTQDGTEVMGPGVLMYHYPGNDIMNVRELISLRTFGLSELDAVRYYVALKMAERGLVSAPNVAVGEPFNYGITSFAAMPGLDSRGAAAPAPQAPHNSAG